VKNCEETGFLSTLIRLPSDVTESDLLEKISHLNSDSGVDGILVQLPLPRHIRESVVIQAINPDKDVDGFHPISAGKLVQGLPTFIPATPYGILLMLEHFQLSTKGKHAVVIGRSNIVGRPMSILLSSNIPFGTLCHSHTPDLAAITRQADILVAALGKPEFVTADMIKSGAIVIDVGITRVADPSAKKGFRIKGDVAFQEVAPLCEAITPVPGGVGLMTIAGLLKNTLQAYQNHTS
jgi:methylenetetrahydrofolate dehydrogenase (NADP+)/methenyltetrahydrofolate cyclohydrolase